MKIACLLLLALVTFTVLCQGETYRKIIHNTDPEAKCLDGTPPLLYLHEGGDKTRFLLFFFGGGICSGMSIDDAIEDCWKRSKTNMGSSSIDWPDTLAAGGYLSTDPTQNRFANWTKIAFGYCDGSLHQGYRKNPIPYKGTNLYFRGAAITRSHIKWIQQHYDLHSAQQVVVTGSSAGGVATLIWSNYIRSKVANGNNVISIQDSGIFLNFTTYQTNVDYLHQTIYNNFKLANIDEKTPLGMCNLKYRGEEYKCLFFEYAFTSFESRVLVVNSEYDTWAIQNTLGLKCLSKGSVSETIANCDSGELEYIERYHQKFRDIMEYYTMVSRHSAWTIGCAHHGYTFDDQFYNSQNEKVPTTTGMTLKEAVESFAFEGKRVMAMETDNWPANSGCAK